MLRLILIAVVAITLIYFIIFLKDKWQALPPQAKKSIFMLGIGSLINLFRHNWRTILSIFTKFLGK